MNGMTEEKIVARLEQLEHALFGGKLEDRFFDEEATVKVLFDDPLEKTTFFIILELALEGKVGSTSTLIADLTDTTKNTVNVRLERLYYKQLIQRQQIGNVLLYYIVRHVTAGRIEA